MELAGMTEHCDFVEQTTVNGSNDRPDLTVKLPEKRTVVVDAKASTAAYMEAQQTGDESASAEALRRHAGALRTQVTCEEYQQRDRKQHGEQKERGRGLSKAQVVPVQARQWR